MNDLKAIAVLLTIVAAIATIYDLFNKYKKRP